MQYRLMPVEVWYNNYDAMRAKVEELRQRFLKRCQDLVVDPNRVIGEFSREIIIRAVLESNWQEGIELTAGQTQKLACAAFDEMEDVTGPHLDMNKILRFHRDAVVRLKRDGASVNELAAYNLARAHHAIAWVGSELAERQAASLAQALRSFEAVYEEFREKLSSQAKSTIERGFAIVNGLEASDDPISRPMTAPPTSSGHLTRELLALDSDSLINPMRSSYIHFMHRLVLMGIMPPEKTGHFRKISVHVGNPDLYFPVPSAVPQMMKEFCRKFPAILPTTVNYDPVLVAAKASHRFAAIHPYEDGNGRMSRLLMNLVLWGHFPPVYLKANKKGRHRYGQALKRADRGNIKPLASLIAMSLIEIFENLLDSIEAASTLG